MKSDIHRIRPYGIVTSCAIRGAWCKERRILCYIELYSRVRKKDKYIYIYIMGKKEYIREYIRPSPTCQM